MDLARFTGMMAARGCTHQDKIFCGTYQGWPFSAAYLRGGANNTVFALRVVFGQRASAAAYSPLPQPAPAQDAAPAIDMRDAPPPATPGERE